MSAFHKKDSLYSEAEARICLSCTMKRCKGTCDRLIEEKKRLYKESIPAPQYELDEEELIIPDEPPWPKKKPYIDKTEEEGTDATF